MEPGWQQQLDRVRDMSDYFQSEHCKSQTSCGDCRGSQAFRQTVLDAYDTPTDVDYDCPHGMSGDNTLGLSDVFVRAAHAAQAHTRRDLAVLAGVVPDLSTEDRDANLAVCQSCPSAKLVNDACEYDGLAVADKAGWATESCPFAHW